MRILIANTPQMYRQTLALCIRALRPDFEVLVAEPAKVDGEVERFAPQAVVRDDDGVETYSQDGVVCWVGIIVDDHLHARISVNGRISRIHDVSLQEVIAALEEAEGLISSSEEGQGPPP
jgi:hypothetical protein